MTLLIVLVLALGAPSFDDPELRVRAAKIHAVNLDAAIVFYHDVLGLPYERRADERLVFDGGSMDLIVDHAEIPSRGGYPGHSQTILVFQTSDIRATMEKLRDRGVQLVDGDEPRPYGFNQSTGKPLGLSTRFRDPSGIVHSLVEQQVDAASFDGIRIYNIGFYLPDMAAARALYCDVLGFAPMTESYLPTALPLLHGDGSFAFMLHARPEMGASPATYPQSAQTLIVFEATDLDDVVEHLSEKKVDVFRTGAGVAAVRDAFGNVSEIVETD